jgi:hypothetical protein
MAISIATFLFAALAGETRVDNREVTGMPAALCLSGALAGK